VRGEKFQKTNPKAQTNSKNQISYPKNFKSPNQQNPPVFTTGFVAAPRPPLLSIFNWFEQITYDRAKVNKRSMFP
jgi:hypothetical protein